jgi:hypothetical protein
LFGALKALNAKLETYYIQTQKAMQLVDNNVHNDRVQRAQRDGLHGLVEVTVRDTDSETGHRTNHVMAVVNGVLVDPSDGSSHPWPDRNAKPDEAHWLRDVTMMFVPMKKIPKAQKKLRIALITRRKRLNVDTGSATKTGHNGENGEQQHQTMHDGDRDNHRNYYEDQKCTPGCCQR